MPVAAPPAIADRAASYQHLARALSANLRRQILLAVCEAPEWRDRLSARLSVEHPDDAPPLVDLELDPAQPNFTAAIASWLQMHPQHPNAIFAIRGIEVLTRQPAATQQRFLRQLHLLDRHLPQLDFNLLLWLTRPWYNTIRDSVPEFWRWHTGLFEFSDELAVVPEPTIPAPPQLQITAASDRAPALTRQNGNARTASLTFQKRPGEFPLLTLAPTPVRRSETSPLPPAADGDSKFAHAPADETLATSDAAASEPVATAPADSAAAATHRPPTVKAAEEASDRSKLPPASHIFVQAPVADAKALADEATTDSLDAASSASDWSAVTPKRREPPPLPPIMSLADVERLEQSQPPEVIARAYLQIGQQYRDRIARGEVSPAQLSVAIQAYEQAVQWQNEGPETAEIFNDLGNFYWLRSRQPEQPEQAFPDLERALSTYQLASTQLPAPETQPETYAMIQNNLGAAYGDLARYRDLVENLQLSVQAYEAALRFRSPKAEPLKYASTQNNLGTAYWHLAQQTEPAENLRSAVQAYQAASPYYSESRDPQSWAMIQNNLGTAYWNLSQYEEPAAWLPEAIAHFENSLRHRTPEARPAACAATQNNLGTAYWQLSQSGELNRTEEIEYLQRAIAAYAVATQIAQHLSAAEPPLPVSFDFLGTFNNLGAVHYQLGTTEHYELPAERCMAHLEAALQAHLQALSNLPPDSASYANTFKLVTRCVRACYDRQGIAGQNRALAQVPGQLLPNLLAKL